MSVNDVQQLTRFAIELRLFQALRLDGHSKDCARWQIWDDSGCTCSRAAKQAKGRR